MQVGPGVGFAPRLVPSHSCVPPEGVVTLWPFVKIGPSKIVLVEPSTRKFTSVGTFARGTNASALHSAVKQRNAKRKEKTVDRIVGRSIEKQRSSES